jgi:SAM-dependent methyltransferase
LARQLDGEDSVKAYWTPARLKNLTNGKKWLLTPESAPDLLLAIGLMRDDGIISRDHVKKLAQVNHMVSLLRPQLEDLKARHKPIRVFDACCGTSYLSLAIAYICNSIWDHPCLVLGLDLNEKVIATSKYRAERLGLEAVTRFVAGKVGSIPLAELFEEEFQSSGRPHLVVSLHACDQASDYAIAAALRAEADVIALAPCCHAELARVWQSLSDREHPLAPIFQTGNIRREIASHMTDMLRILQIRGKGYEVTATEFVASEHTPKNRMILAERRGRYHTPSIRDYERLVREIGGKELILADLLRDVGQDA